MDAFLEAVMVGGGFRAPVLQPCMWVGWEAETVNTVSTGWSMDVNMLHRCTLSLPLPLPLSHSLQSDGTTCCY
jgi:hypothetical protein